jgi:hypothetical protein
MRQNHPRSSEGRAIAEAKPRRPIHIMGNDQAHIFIILLDNVPYCFVAFIYTHDTRSGINIFTCYFLRKTLQKT